MSEYAHRIPMMLVAVAIRKLYRLLLLMLLIGTVCVAHATAGEAEQPSLPSSSLQAVWLTLEPGLEFHIFDLDAQHVRQLIVLRIDPAYFMFRLFSVSEYGGRPRSLRQWAQRHGLTAVINASMYLPDHRTSTGYLRQDSHSNNGRIVRNYGSIFAAEPLDPSLPLAQLCDKDISPCRERVEAYRCVMQNFRIINGQREIVWSALNKPAAISAIAQDSAGRILFLHCREALAVRDFAAYLLSLPLDVRSAMYVEGGAQAGLFVHTPRLTHLWQGRHAADFLAGIFIHAPLPNVLGILPRTKPRKKS